MSDEPDLPKRLESLPENDRSGAELRNMHEELRELRRMFHEKVGARNTAHNGDAFGGDKLDGDKFFGDKHVHVSKGDDPWRIVPILPERRDDLGRRLVGTPAREALIRLLEKGVVAVLKGPPGTGRKTTALAAMAHRRRELRMIRSRKSPAFLEKEKLAFDHAYLYDASGQSWAKTLTETDVLGCWDILSAFNSRLVIVVGPDSDTDGLSWLVTNHRPPDTREVLARHLSDRLADGALDIDVPEVIARVEEPPTSPREAAELAIDLVRGIKLNESVEEVCASRLAPRRREARAVLRQRDGDKDLGRRAFVIAGAVLDGLPTVRVCRAAYDLAGRLFEVEKPGKDAELGLLPLADMLDDWLRQAREEQPHVVQEMDRRLSFRAGFATAVMDAVWLDYVVAHQALLAWLSQLAGDGDLRVRLKAAQAAGRFATYDFDFVYDHCIAEWSASRFEALHMAAAWALEAIVAECPERHDRVADLVWTWSQDMRPGGLARQSTAVRLLGTLLGTRAVARAMEALQSIARRHPDALNAAVRDTVVELYAGDASSMVIEHLLGWMRSHPYELGPLVADCLMKIAQLPYDGRPPLLAHYDEEPALVGDLWREALLARHGGQGPWNVLRDWTKDGIRFDTLLRDLYSEPRLRPRLRFYGFASKERTT